MTLSAGSATTVVQRALSDLWELSRRGAHAFVLVLALLVGACEEDLYTGLSEREANEMLALLLRYGIDASKTAGKDNLVTLSVEDTRLADAVNLLRTHGYPRDHFVSIGDVFQQQGLVSSPTEDRIRLVYALSQEMNETLSQIDGVLSARVHLVMPSTSANGTIVSSSSAAVFLRYQDTYDIQQLVSQIKTLVANSIEDLSYDRVSVALFPVRVEVPPEPDPAPEYRQILDFDVSPASYEPLLLTLGGLALVIVLLIGSNVAVFLLMRRRGTLPARQKPA
jgi:type III secretion protein J